MNDLITNGTEIKQRILAEINNAKQCIYIAMAWFTDRDIAMAIIEAKNRDLTIDIILSSNIQNDTVKLMLKGANISVHAFETGDVRGIMHHKFCLIDNKISINGSYNYSINASNNNVENIQVSDDIAIHSQFLAEFERLKYNIDHHIDLNEKVLISENKSQNIQPINIIDTFSQQLHSLVYSAAQIDPEKYTENGYNASKESQGNIDIFRTEYNHIKEKIRTYATDEGLGSKKNTLISNISVAYESIRINMDSEKQDKISVKKRNNELEKDQTNSKIADVKLQKLLLESGNQNTGEKGLLQINKEIEKNKLERKSLEQTFIIKKFWGLDTVLVTILLLIFAFYLSLFFASAIYKVFFEENLINAAFEAGIRPNLPQLVDANAIVKIFNQQGFLFGGIATIFFIFPVLLSNIKIFGIGNKWINIILFLLGLVVFDIVVSAVVVINIDKINSLLQGIDPKVTFWNAFEKAEFWLMLVFGMIPLLITHYTIGYITKAYKNSQRNIVDAEKNRRILFLDEEMIEFNAEKDNLNSKIKDKDEVLQQYNTKIFSLETEINNLINQIENQYVELQKQIKSIFDDYIARITSGRIFTDVIFDSVVSAYKSGFIEFLPQYYAADEVASRVKEIENTTLSINQ